MTNDSVFTMEIRANTRNGNLEVDPTFTKDAAIFHPLPKSLKQYYQVGDKVEGKFGIERPTGRNDKRGKPIFTAFFIPLEHIRGNHGSE